MNAEAFTFSEFLEYLKTVNMKPALVDEASSLLSELEKMNYSTVSVSDADFLKKLQNFVKELERMLKTIFALLLLISTHSYGDVVKDELYKASLLYDQGDYAEASKIYEKLVADKVELAWSLL